MKIGMFHSVKYCPPDPPQNNGPGFYWSRGYTESFGPGDSGITREPGETCEWLWVDMNGQEFRGMAESPKACIEAANAASGQDVVAIVCKRLAKLARKRRRRWWQFWRKG